MYLSTQVIDYLKEMVFVIEYIFDHVMVDVHNYIFGRICN